MFDDYTTWVLIIVIIIVILLIVIIIISHQEPEDTVFESDFSFTTDQNNMKLLAAKHFEKIPIKDRLHGSNELGMYNLSVHKYRDGYQGVIRGSSSDGCRILAPGPLFSYIFYVYFNNNGEIIETRLLDLDYKNMIGCSGKFGFETNGVEDPKMFIFRGEQWVVANVLGSNEQADFCKNAICIFKVKNSRESYRVLKVPNGYNINQTQKNWGFFEYENNLYCEYSISPHVILKVDIETGETIELYKTGKNKNDTDVVNYGSLRGGGNAIKTIINGKEYYLNVGHVTKHHDYKQFFYLFNSQPPFDVLKISQPSKLDHKARIQFAAGISEYNNNIYVSYGISDCYNRISIFSKDKINKCLLPFS